MKWLVFLIPFYLISCKRNHTSVLVKTLDNETGASIPNIKIKVYRKGKKNLFVEKDALVVAEGQTNIHGEDLLNFKYDRGNTYSVEVFEGNGYWGNSIYLWKDLEKGKNEAKFDLYPYCYFKLSLESSYPNSKILNVEVEGVSNGYLLYSSFHNDFNSIDSTVFRTMAINKGNRNITWTVDSAGTRKNYSLPVQLRGHDTTYATINF